MADEQFPDTGEKLDFDWNELEKPQEPCPHCKSMMPADAVVCDYCGCPSSGVGRRRLKIWRYVLLAVVVYIAIGGIQMLVELLTE
ncbi:MAG: hypothetical protein KDA88_21530 [Planctomycetaceae bacterium]|nr:hypothetical protein [Planctomycetaceae bacterium]MCB9950185.1 hypothetical protein [Planctomycetaceae bacterium]